MKIAVAKSILVLFLLVSVAASLPAQEVCDLKTKTAPLVLNLRLGMSPEKARAVFGKDLKIKIKKSGERTFFRNYIKQPAPERLRGVRALYLRFFDRMLYQIEIFYEPRADLATLENVTDSLASQLNFADSNWQIKNNRARIACGETSIVADNILNPRIELTDENIRALVKESRKKDAK